MVIDGDDTKILKRLPFQGLKCFIQSLFRIIERYEDGTFHRDWRNLLNESNEDRSEKCSDIIFLAFWRISPA